MKHRRILWNLRLRHPRLLAVGLLMGAVVVTMAAGSFASGGSGGTGSSLPETSDTESKGNHDPADGGFPDGRNAGGVGAGHVLADEWGRGSSFSEKV